MRPLDVQQIGEELAIKWDDGSEGYVSLKKLRRFCPCATCKGEMDVMGHVYKGPDLPLTSAAFQLRRITSVGGYAVQPVWGDGHATGIYSYDYLKRVAAAPEIERGHE
ncbi:MAG: gamma-butyrobetaine hydroxylase-like domain-containing protein [Verrucomicrobiia bacterium]